MKIFLTIITAGFIINLYSQPSTDYKMDLLSIEFSVMSSNDRSNIQELIIQKSEILKDNGLFSDALDELNRIDTSLYKNTTELCYLKSLNFFLMKDYTQCYNSLLEIFDSTRTGINKYTVLWLFTLNEMGRWDECKKTLLEVCETNSTDYQVINNLPVLIPSKSPLKAIKLSGYFPGLGQIYSGYPFRGITSLVLISAFTSVAVIGIMSGLYVTSVVWGLLPVIKLYLGGRQFSYKLANKKNEENTNLLKQEYLKIIISIENN